LNDGNKSKICQRKNGEKKYRFLRDCIDAGGGCISVIKAGGLFLAEEDYYSSCIYESFNLANNFSCLLKINQLIKKAKPYAVKTFVYLRVEPTLPIGNEFSNPSYIASLKL
jgi:hypothetical protein